MPYKFPLERFTKKKNYRWYILSVVLIGAFMSALDLNLMYIINPTLQKVFLQPLYIVEWASLAYQLTLTALLPVIGRISDIVGRKKFYNTGFVIFIIGSGMVGLGLSMDWIIGWRVVQSIGAAFLQSNSIAIISANFPGNERGKAIGIQGAVQAVGMSIGPSFGGFIVQNIGWNYAFYINVPVGILGTILALLILPESKSGGKKEKIDYVGAALFTGMLIVFLYNFSMSSQSSYSNFQLYLLYALVIILLIIFIIHGLRNENCIIDFSLFKNYEYVTGNITGLLSYLIIGASLFMLPYYLEYVLNYKEMIAGTIIITVPVFMGIGTPISGAIADKIGYYKPSVTGFLLMVLGTVLLSLTSSNSSIIYVLFTLAILGFGMGLFTAPNNSSVMSLSPPGKLSLVGGFLNMMRSLGNIFGIAVATFIFELYAKESIIIVTVNKEKIFMGYHSVMLALFIISIIGFILTLIRKSTGRGKIINLPEI
ncbi:MAG: MFS transporter [Thermoplasmata archaeon]